MPSSMPRSEAGLGRRPQPWSQTGPRFTLRALTEEQAAELLRPQTARPGWPVTGTVLMHAPAPDIARWLHRDQGQVTALDARTFRVELGGWSSGSLVATLLLFETDFEILDPPQLRGAAQEVKDRLRRALSHMR